jgi:hypothetical protein
MILKINNDYVRKELQSIYLSNKNVLLYLDVETEF